MATFDRLADVRPQLTARLEPGEPLRAALRIELTAGSDEARGAARRSAMRGRLGDLATPADNPASAAGRLARRIGGAVLDLVSNTSPLKTQAPDLPDPSGIAVAGGAGSHAVRLRDLLSGSAEHVLVVTDRRSFVLADGHGAPARFRAARGGTAPLPYELIAEIPHSELVSARHRAAGLARARVELAFADGSVLAVSALSSANADELERAFGR